ncbi:hypothetical protein NO263_13220 [Gluconacetobacter entanii]|uniref:Uncharacterized protein n=1 Tax=Gluconacetobacter entanii TaxID=108528 RepID=A0ABT3K800_9PROT|nr:hypothetical protein [Gluconacetobacter entanii]MCW4591542.1 hypothetical protein [Gluconacetobacter entanii]MCW4595414.1 hypothetical protein [Gluconacetobacter entanii]NPC89843.1 hypothetical protein [Gluconacetobacter entanii]
MSIAILNPRGTSAPPVRPDALQAAVNHRQAAAHALRSILPQQACDGIVLLMSERRAIRAAMAHLESMIVEEEAQLARLAQHQAASRLLLTGRGAA